LVVRGQRREVACALTNKYIRLEKINPTDRMKLVEPSGLLIVTTIGRTPDESLQTAADRKRREAIHLHLAWPSQERM
jgi:hypothetical protein